MKTEQLIFIVFACGVGTALLACVAGALNIVGGLRGIYEGCCVNQVSPDDEDDSDDEAGARPRPTHARAHRNRHAPLHSKKTNCLLFFFISPQVRFFSLCVLLLLTPRLRTPQSARSLNKRQHARALQTWRKGWRRGPGEQDRRR